MQATLKAEAKARGIGLDTCLRQLAAGAAREICRKRIRTQSEAVGRYTAENPTQSRITDEHLSRIRRQLAQAIGLVQVSLQSFRQDPPRLDHPLQPLLRRQLKRRYYIQVANAGCP